MDGHAGGGAGHFFRGTSFGLRRRCTQGTVSARGVEMARVTGIGGVFFKAKDPKALAGWYATHLGVKLEDWGGAIFRWKADQDVQPATGLTVWHLADADGEWFAPSTKHVMINYRVDDLDELLEQLAVAGISTLKGPDEAFNGRFAWVMDPEGNKVELWEPRDPG